METKFENAADFIKTNQEKIKTPMFFSSLIVFVAYLLFWGFSKEGYLSGITSLVNVIKDYRLFIGFDGELDIFFYYLLLCLIVIPISSGYLMYASWNGTMQYVKIAKIALLISFLPFFLKAIFSPFLLFGLFASVLSVAYMFLPNIGNKVIAKSRNFLNKNRSK
jgi:hypothetical protein